MKLPPDLELQKFLFGRALLRTELPFEESLIQNQIANGYIATVPGIEENRCTRCGNKDTTMLATYPCFRCGKNCLYCRNCIMMGRVSSCTPLYIWNGPPITWLSSKCYWSGQLSAQQAEASAKILDALNRQEDCLIWAVAGSGKTEISFAGIEAALQFGLRICLACPRTDVILELEPRIKDAFPETSVAVLYGNSDEKHSCAQLILATTHQLYRFKNAFDLLIIDEVDAFPYSMDSSLQFAAKEAAKEQATTIYLTATPSRKWQQEFFTGKRNGILIPARYHRHPNPVPTMRWIGNWRKALKKGQLPRPLSNWLQQQRHPFMIFFPHIEFMQTALPLVQHYFPTVVSVHAEDSDRKEKVHALRCEEIPGILTTTILERGVTIKGVNVAVVGAEDRTFTEAALVQIAGRVGRNIARPYGDVLFLHNGKTHEMTAAIRQIERNNRLAFQKGLIDYE